MTGHSVATCVLSWRRLRNNMARERSVAKQDFSRLITYTCGFPFCGEYFATITFKSSLLCVYLRRFREIHVS